MWDVGRGRGGLKKCRAGLGDSLDENANGLERTKAERVAPNTRDISRPPQMRARSPSRSVQEEEEEEEEGMSDVARLKLAARSGS